MSLCIDQGIVKAKHCENMEIDVGLQPYEIFWFFLVHVNNDKILPKEMSKAIFVDQYNVLA